MSYTAAQPSISQNGKLQNNILGCFTIIVPAILKSNLCLHALVGFTYGLEIMMIFTARCISYDRFCLTVRPSDRLPVIRRYHAKTTPATIMRSSLEDSPMTLVS